MIYKRGNVFWYEFSVNGTRIRESARTSNKVRALRAEANRRVGYTPQAKSKAFGDFVRTDFLVWSQAQNKPNTHKRYSVSSRVLERFFGTMKLDRISTAHIEQFKIARLKECSPSGVNRDLAALRLMLNFAVRNGYVRASPFKGVRLLKEGPGMMRILSPEEEEAYLQAAYPRLRDIAVLILDTGMRPEEVYHIRGENVHLERSYIFVPGGKTVFARRNIPLTQRAAEVLRRRMNDGYLFSHRKHAHLPITQVNRGHTNTLKKLDFAFRLYDLRHTYGSRMAMAGVDLPTLKELMGHSSIAMTVRYVHPTPAHKIESVQKLQRFNSTHNFTHNARIRVCKSLRRDG